MDLARELKKQWNMKVMVIRIVIGALEIGQNTEKSPGDLWKLVVTRTLVKDSHGVK